MNLYLSRVILWLDFQGCNKYSTRIASTQDKFDLKYYYKDADEKSESKFMFNGIFFIDRPENSSLAVKVRFYEFHDRPGDFYEIGKFCSIACIKHVDLLSNLLNSRRQFKLFYFIETAYVKCQPIIS